MAKVKYDVSDVEAGTDFDTPVPRGAYRCIINDCTHGASQKSGDPMLTVEYEIIQRGEWKGRRLWDYIVLKETSAWKLRQFTDALELKESGTLDTDKVTGKKVLVRVKHETDDRDPENPVVRARVGNVSPIPDTGEEEPEEEEAEEPDDAEEEEDDAEPEEEEDEFLTEADLEEMDRAALKALIKEEELEIRVTKGMADAAIREAISEALELGEEEPDAEEEDEPEEEEEPDDETADYSEMTIAELTTELKSRGLNTTTKLKGDRKKKVFIDRLEKDDNDGGDPF